MLQVRRTNRWIKPDESRVFFRPFEPSSRSRVLKIIARVMMLSEKEAEVQAEHVRAEFGKRHHAMTEFLERQAERVMAEVMTDHPLSRARRLLLGAYFGHEYSLEAAALFNPSIVPHPDQSGVPEGSLRFVLSLRATGEGHISSIVFRTGVVDAQGEIELDPCSPYVTPPEVHPNPTYEKRLFERKLLELGLLNPVAERLLAQLDDSFTLDELESACRQALRRNRAAGPELEHTTRGILALAQANYEICFDPERPFSERVIFPYTPSESRGIEDARFVAFQEDDGQVIYYATYTAFDGQVILPQLLETQDFARFRINTLNGPEVQNKGMALFPRKINGHYAMLSRQDNENLYLMYSDMLHFWYTKQLLLRPTYPWEFVQVGNCGSPIETEAGWLVITHGVGPMRRYVLGAILLDREDPSRVIGRLREPLLEPSPREREGYVPNVVYSCGALVHAGLLVLPYAVSDQCSSFALVPLDDLLKELSKNRVG